MSDKNTVELILSAKNEKLVNALIQGEKHIKAFGDKTTATFQRAGQSMNMFSNKVITGMAAIGISYGVVEMGKDMLEFDGTLRRIGRTSGQSAKDIQGLRQTIVGLISPDAKLKVPLTKGEWADMAWELNATGIQLNIIKDLLPQVGKGAVAADVNNKIYAATIGELLDKYKVLVKDMPALQEQLNMAMKFQDVRKNPEQFLQALTGMAKTMQLIGASGMENVTPLIALVAELTAISGSAADAQGSVEALMNGIFRLSKNRPKIAELKAHGIEFFNKEGGMKNIEELIPQIKKLSDEAAKAGLDMDTVAMNVFGRPEAGKAMMALVKKYDEIKEKQAQLRASSGELEKDFGIEMGSMNSKLKEFQNQLDRFKVEHMTTALNLLTHVLDMLNKHPMIAKGILGTVVGVGSAVILSKMIGGLINFGRDIGGIWTGKGKGGIGGVVGALGRVTPVFVTNWPGGELIDTAAKTGSMVKMGTWLKTNLPWLVAGGLGLTTTAIGTAILTTGTAAHAGYDALKGGSGENWINEKLGNEPHDYLYDYFHKGKDANVKNEIKLTINIDKDGRVLADNPNKETDVNIDLNRGTPFGGKK